MAPQDPELEYREFLRRRLSVLPRQAVAWLVLAPEWPQELVSIAFPMHNGVIGAGNEPIAMLESVSNDPDAIVERSNPERSDFGYRRPRPIVQASIALSPWKARPFASRRNCAPPLLKT